MRLDDDDLDEVDLSVSHAITRLFEAGASRAQAEQALRERVSVLFDELADFEAMSLCPVYHLSVH